MRVTSHTPVATALPDNVVATRRNGSSDSRIINVWLIEPDEVFRNSLANALLHTEDIFCRREFAEISLALEALKDDAEPEIVLMGLQPKDADASDAVRQFKADYPLMLIVVLSDSHDPDNISRAISAGASGYLLRSASLAKIVESIREVHEGGACLAPRVAHAMLDMFRLLSSSPPAHYRFTRQEQRVLELMTRGLLMKEIADHLTVSYHTVDTHLRNIYSKLNVHTRTGAVAKVLRERLI
jgi:DNA-binding NarL/FixJ family response regulator